jgi:peptidoglycan L-alanyl-D-glutamate endopeptidase CwlK
MDARSERNLQGVHADLVRLVRATHEDYLATGRDFIVTEGLRTQKRQEELYKAGASQTLNSRHLTGHAVDLAVKVSGKVEWAWPLYFQLAALMKSNALRLEVPIIWGGDWTTFKDGPHYELARAFYP